MKGVICTIVLNSFLLVVVYNFSVKCLRRLVKNISMSIYLTIGCIHHHFLKVNNFLIVSIFFVNVPCYHTPLKIYSVSSQ